VESLYKEAIKKMNKNYEVLMEIEDEEKITFYIDESGGIIKELVMVMGGQNEFMILTLEGDIDLKEISKLSKSVNISGMEKLESVEDAE
jgi:ACT domain-containing protein